MTKNLPPSVRDVTPKRFAGVANEWRRTPCCAEATQRRKSRFSDELPRHSDRATFSSTSPSPADMGARRASESAHYLADTSI
jgi:hypothetical protein